MGVRTLVKAKALKMAFGAFVVMVIGITVVVKMNPVVFNESFFGHAHCITQAGMALRIYANEHSGRLPQHTNGFADALIPLIDDSGAYPFTGPMFDSSELLSAKESGRDADESKIGRVYVQGLSSTDSPAIAVLFDQLATPGGDHCHFINRFLAPYGREVGLLDGSHQFVTVGEWYSFATNQIELLVAAGVERQLARSHYELTGLNFDD